MRTAICFSGELRTFRVAVPRILEYFTGYNADIFCHTWETTGDTEHNSIDFQLLEQLIENSEHTLCNLKIEKSINHSVPFGNML